MSLTEYLIRSSALLVIMLLVYLVFLKNRAKHSHSRAYILFSFIISMASPFIQFGNSPTITNIPQYVMEGISINSGEARTATQGLPLSSLVIYYCIILSSFFAFRLLFGLGRILYLRIHFPSYREKSGRIILIPKSKPVFSFFRMIFIHNTLVNTEVHEHEKQHIKLWHSADRLFIALIGIVFWLNPAYWLFKKELERVHEYQADGAVLNRGIERKKYQNLLLSLSMGYPTALPVNQFNKSFIKNRIKMMNKKNNLRKTSWLFALPFVLATVWIMACSHSTPATQQNAEPEATPEQTEKVHDEVDKMTEFPGGQEAMIQFFVDNIKYPEKARKEGIEGKVFVKFTVAKDGKITNVAIQESVSPELDAEAMRVVEMMPDWIPGEKDGKAVAVEITLPVKFALSDKDDK